ncbi:hypothetical protein [Phenylobacterium sp.]|uniref:hypothetical protein n=1 Tax=Phenylobacterium sp. TaxID=1871053 RepID=UPI0035B1A0E2
MDPDRRRAAAQQPAFDYLFLRGEADAEGVAQGLASAGATIVGRFTPQLGWASDEAALLIGWPGGASPAVEQRRAAWAGERLEHHALTPTARPTHLAPATPGGIYVHRWFTVLPDAVDEFVALSVEGWRDFETRFEASIHGLFLASSQAAGAPAGARNLLLLTRYASHQVWEASRDPTTAAMAAFRRRRALTLRTWAASTLLAAG